MRKKIVAGNWKMNKSFEEGCSLFNKIEFLLSEQLVLNDVEIIIFPSYIFLSNFVLCSSKIKIGAQNCSEHSVGAYTGEVSALMISSVGVKYVLVGHSERRIYNNETSDQISGKIKNIITNAMTPILCIGESLEERKSGVTRKIIEKQIKDVFNDNLLSNAQEIIIAYEPIWAIGTGLTATPEEAQEIHAFIRETASCQIGTQRSITLPILYGGSCNSKNAQELFSMPDIDGGLIGGASLVAEDFIQIAKSFK